MPLFEQVDAFRRTALVAGALTLAGCVPNAYLYDDAPAGYYGGGGGSYPSTYYYGYPGYYGSAGYYGQPGYYGYAPYPPRAVYYNHDHRGDDCRHPSHRDGGRHDGRDGHDRDDRDGHDRDGRDRDGDRRDARPGYRLPDGPRLGPPANQPPKHPRGARPDGESRPAKAPQSSGLRTPRVPEPKEPAKPPEARKELD